MIYFLIFSLLYPVLARADDMQGQVITVADGDTLTILHNRKALRVRLSEIDAPEKAQDFGQRSRQSLIELCLTTSAQIKSQGRDRYGRTLGRVWCAGVDVNAEQVHRGLAWVYDNYATDRSLYAIQNEARGAHRGLWADPNPVPPWKWRRNAHSMLY